MSQQRMSEETAQRIQRTIWQALVQNARREHPDYEFFTRSGNIPGLADWPAHISRALVEHPAGEDLDALRKDRLAWPQRPVVQPRPATRTAEQVAGMLAVHGACEQDAGTVYGDGNAIHARTVTLTRRDSPHALQVMWETMVEGRNDFHKPWPASAAAALEQTARKAAEVDDGRDARQWELATRPRTQDGGEPVAALDEETLSLIFNAAVDRAYELYRFLGADAYEQLVAPLREPLSLALLRAEDPGERRQRHADAAAELASRLRERRRDLRLRRDTVAAACGLTVSRLGAIERGRAPDLAELACLCEAYGLDVRDLAAPFAAADDA